LESGDLCVESWEPIGECPAPRRGLAAGLPLRPHGGPLVARRVPCPGGRRRPDRAGRPPLRVPYGFHGIWLPDADRDAARWCRDQRRCQEESRPAVLSVRVGASSATRTANWFLLSIGARRPSAD